MSSELLTQLNQLNDDLKILLQDSYIDINVLSIHKLIVKSLNFDESKLKIIVTSIDVLMTIIDYINISKFVSIQWIKTKFKFDIKQFIIETLKSKISNINEIINAKELEPIFENVQIIFSDTNLISKNIIKCKNIKDIKFTHIKIINSNTPKTELNHLMNKMIDELIDLLKILISTSKEHLNKLSDRYISAIKQNLILPYQYYPMILNTYMHIKSYLSCINWSELCVKLLEFNIQPINFDIINFIKSKLNSSDVKLKSLLSNITTKYSNIIDCINYILKNPRVSLINLQKSFEIVEDTVFN